MAAIFFDIDGTLWDANKGNFIPESTKEAVRLLQKNGHHTFICTGRTRCLVLSPLDKLGFDGFLCGCGTHIEYKGETLLYKTLDRDLMEKSVDIFYEYDMPIVLEGRYMLYMDPEIISRDPYGNYLLNIMKGNTMPVRNNEKYWEASKYTVLIDNTDFESMTEKLSKYYEFLNHGNFAMEIVPKGYSKATSIDFICKYLGISTNDTYAFGDSVNDIQMLDFAKYGVVMGNGTDIAKEHADYVTDSLYDDGIFNACKHFDLI